MRAEQTKPRGERHGGFLRGSEIGSGSDAIRVHSMGGEGYGFVGNGLNEMNNL